MSVGVLRGQPVGIAFCWRPSLDLFAIELSTGSPIRGTLTSVAIVFGALLERYLGTPTTPAPEATPARAAAGE